MTKLRLLSIAVIGLLIINIGIVGFLLLRKPPMPPEGRPPMGQGGHQPMKTEGPKKIIIERLHFDESQVTAYEKLIEGHQTAVKSLDDSINTTKNNLYQTLTVDTFAGKDLLLNRLAEFQNQIERIHFDHFAEIKKLCKPGQLEYFNKMTKDLTRFFAIDKKGARPQND